MYIPHMESDQQNIEQEIKDFGLEIFKRIGNAQPNVFNKNFLHSKLMQWSFDKPDFKNSLFRLVDVLPSLKTNKAISEHVEQYLLEPAQDLNSVLGLGIKTLRLGSLTAGIGSLAVKKSINQMASVFIAGARPKDALPALKKLLSSDTAFTVDLLGEYSVNSQESEHYLNRYLEALDVIGAANLKNKTANHPHPGLSNILNMSVKLSALYSQTHVLNFEKSVEVLSERLGQVVERAQKYSAHLYIDAEDTAHNPIIYATFKKVFSKDLSLIHI